jgi:arginase
MNNIPKMISRTHQGGNAIINKSFTLCPIFIGQKLYGPCQAPMIVSKKINSVSKYDDFLTYKLKFNNAYHECNPQQNLLNVLRYNEDIYKSNKKSLEIHDLNINIGGDHSIAIGSVSASLEKYKEDLVLIWIDAHADINNIYMSKSKNIHGMPLDILTKPDWKWEISKLKYEQIIYIGLRDCDDYEIKIIEDNKIRYWASNEINNLDNFNNHRSTFISLLNTITKNKKIHLSLDVDALDPEHIPCTGTSVPGGLSMNFVTDLISSLKGNIVNADIVELNLDLKTKKDQEKSLKNTMELISSFI